MSLRPSHLALSGLSADSMYVVIDDPGCAAPLLIPCSWQHRRTDVGREQLREEFELHDARGVELIAALKQEIEVLDQELSDHAAEAERLPENNRKSCQRSLSFVKQHRDRLQLLLDEASGAAEVELADSDLGAEAA